MTYVAVEAPHSSAHLDPWNAARATVFWAFILLVIASPAVLGALILMRA